MKTIIYFLIASCIALCIACNSGQNKEQQEPKSIVLVNEVANSENIIFEAISSVPNPLEMSLLLHQSGVVYNESLLNSPKNLANYKSNIKKALNMGIYCTDFIHMTIYSKANATTNYLESIHNLAKDLQVGEKLNHNQLNRLIKDNKKVDSILFLVNYSFDKMYNRLIDADKSSFAVLISYGTWVESMYLATNVKKLINSDNVDLRIGEQKYVVDNMYLMLSLFNNQQEFKELLTDLEMLKKEYDKISVTYQYNSPTTKEIDGSLVIIDNSVSKINIKAENIDNISKIIKQIREKLVS